MVKIIFKYKDEYTHGEWRTQSCIMRSLQECIEFYGLNGIEYEIISQEKI